MEKFLFWVYRTWCRISGTRPEQTEAMCQAAGYGMAFWDMLTNTLKKYEGKEVQPQTDLEKELLKDLYNILPLGIEFSHKVLDMCVAYEGIPDKRVKSKKRQ